MKPFMIRTERIERGVDVRNDLEWRSSTSAMIENRAVNRV